jgi:Cft2 family RNA processing exonuclease
MSQRRLAKSERPDYLACLAYGIGDGEDGVCLLLQMGAHRLMLDCGLTDVRPLSTDKDPPADIVLCSHAHGDRAQGLLELHRHYPALPIYASEVTTKLLPLNWTDVPLEETQQVCQSLPWRSSLEISPCLSVELYPAGHIPGAAATAITYKTAKRQYKILYTGDFSLSNFQLVEGLSIDELRGLSPDILIVEGSYGTIRHPHRRQQEKQLMEKIYAAVTAGHNILLPLPSIGLGQEILKLLRSHHQFTGRDIDIWVDGDLAKACDVYLDLLPQFPASVQNFAKHQALFWDDRICPKMRRFPTDQKNIATTSPYILAIDARSDWQKYLKDDRQEWSILIPDLPPNYPAYRFDPSETGIKAPERVCIETYLLAEHSDGRNLTQLIHNLRPQHVVFVNGSPDYLKDLTGLEELHNRYQLHCPSVGKVVELPIGEKFLQPATPLPSHYEGEINESGGYINVTLPDSLNNDPRWNNFADTGLIEARWQGEELVLRGLSQRELLSHGNDARVFDDLDCCSGCAHYRNQKCWNQFSPLYSFKVTPDGYCPVFEAASEPEDNRD